jgi:prevent-host-death family protein
MPVIKPLSELRQRPNAIARLARESREPVFLTRNGKGDLVVMSMEQYTSLHSRLTLYQELQLAEESRARGDKGKTLSGITRKLRKQLRATGKV